ncbi:MAG TPA: tetratricopeptide repeat protein [Chthonomonadaceae bacterium]|nr:tetratricopeptide repeat protein [Chthonomonadaceae bacterium]
MAAEIFISYARKDNRKVLPLVRHLRDAGISVWLDTSDIDAGVQWRPEIEKGIKDCQVVLLMLSASSAASEEVGKEIVFAQKLEKPIVPLVLEPVALPPALLFLEDIQQVILFGEGLQQRWQALGSSLVRLGVKLERSLEGFDQNLPLASTSFIGRQKEMQEIGELLLQARLLTLTGAGGCGKTRLALEITKANLGAYPDGVWLVELADLSDPSLVPQQLATVLGLREEPGRTLTETLRDYLQPRTVLLLLDNCEHLITACAELADRLLRGCPQLGIFATSREALGVPGEQIYRTPPLFAPYPAHLPKNEKDLAVIVSGYDAPRLFVERAGLKKPGFALTTQNAAVVASVCYRLDGIPLAVELAAARVSVLSVEEISMHLEHRFRLLISGSSTVLPRQQTLQATLDWSYELLTEQERLLLSRLCVFAGGWTLEAAEAVCAEEQDSVLAMLSSGKRVEREGMMDILASLVEKSLVIVEEREGKSRYRMLETIREYASERLREKREEKLWHGRHLNFFLNLAEEAETKLTGAEQAEWLERLQEENENLQAALNCCTIDKEKVEPCVQLWGAIWRYWYIRGCYSEGREQLQAALSQDARNFRSQAWAKAFYGLGSLILMQGDYAAARSQFEESLAISRELGDKRYMAASLIGLGNVAMDQGDYAAGQAFYEECLALFRELGDKRGISVVLNNLGNVAYHQSNYKADRALQEESLEIQRELGDKRSIAISLNNLGNVAYHQGDYTAAHAFYEECLALFRQLGDKWGVSIALNGAGGVAKACGDYGAAGALYEESLSLSKETGGKSGVASALSNLGEVAYREGDYAKASCFYKESLVIRRKIEEKPGIAESLRDMADLAAGQGQFEMAARLWAAAEVLRETIGSPLPPKEKEEVDRKVATARASLGEEAFASAWEQGQAMTFEQAIEYALQENPQESKGRPAE